MGYVRVGGKEHTERDGMKASMGGIGGGVVLNRPAFSFRVNNLASDGYCMLLC